MAFDLASAKPVGATQAPGVVPSAAPAAAPARGGFDLSTAKPVSASQPAQAAPVAGSPAAAAGYGRGGRAPTQQTLNAMRDSTGANIIEGAITDPIGTAKAIPAGFNRGVAALVGLPVDAAANVVDLGGMFYGASRSLLDRGNMSRAEEFYTPLDRAKQIGTGEYNANLLDRGSMALTGETVTQNPSPNNPAARLAYNVGAAIPGAATARGLASNAAGGTTQGVIAEAGGDPATQALGGLAGGRAVPGSPRQPQRQPAPGGSFGRDSASAAAATPDLSSVPQELRAPLVEAFQRGERDMAQRVAKGRSLPIPIDYTEGQARQDSGLMSDEWNMRGVHREIANRFDDQNQQLIDNLDEIRREVSPNVVSNNHIQNGQATIDSYKSMDLPERGAIGRDYEKLAEANGGQLPINAKTFVEAADASLARSLKTEFLPPQIERQLNTFRERGGMMTFEQYEGLRTNLATAARDADRGVLAGGGNAAAAINQVRDALEAVPFEGVSAELKALADQARGRARARFEKLRADPAYRAAVDDPTPIGESSPLADDFVKKFIVGGKRENIRRMQENLARDPLASETIAAAALNYLKSKTGVNLETNQGNFSQHGYNSVGLRDLGPRLDVLVPARTAEQLQLLGEVAQELQIQRKGGTFNNSNTFSSAAKDAAKRYAEGTLNTVVPGAQIGSFIRQRRAEARDVQRAARALDPRQYLRATNENARTPLRPPPTAIGSDEPGNALSRP